MSLNPLEYKRKVYKQQLLAIVNNNPDFSTQRAIGIFSQQTGVSHSRARIYIDELIAEGLMEERFTNA